MAQLAPTRLADQLPAVFRERDADRAGFLGRFLQAFEAVFDGVRAEAALVTTLFAVEPTPVLREHASVRDDILYIDSGAGLCPGDVLQIEDILRPAGELDPRVEFVTIKELRGRDPRPELPSNLPTVTPRTIEIVNPLRYKHVLHAQLRRVGRPVVSAPLIGVGLPGVAGAELQ